jgi:hypothetical protein
VTRTHLKIAALMLLMLAVLPVRAQNAGSVKISAMKGTVHLVRGQAAPVPLTKHDLLQADDEILTGDRSSATLVMKDGSSVRVYPNSHIVLRPESGTWKEFLFVMLGNVRVQIEKLSGRPNPKKVTTPTAIIGVRGTIFAVAVDLAQDTEVGVEQGLVSVANLAFPDDEVMVQPGRSVWVRGNQRPGQPQLRKKSMTGINMNGWRGERSEGAGGMGNARGSGMQSGGLRGSGKSGSRR